ncbi:MAG TPA: hypothetical protein VIP77_04280 [Jiangellaceae bacterium]
MIPRLCCARWFDLARRARDRAAAAGDARRAARPGEHLPKPVRQLSESVSDTHEGQLNLERHGGRTFQGVAVRVAKRILAMTAAIWHNHRTSQPVTRSLIAYDQKESLV